MRMQQVDSECDSDTATVQSILFVNEDGDEYADADEADSSVTQGTGNEEQS